MLITMIDSSVDAEMPRSLRRHASVRGQRGLWPTLLTPFDIAQGSGEEGFLKDADSSTLYPSTRFAMKMSGLPGPLASGSAPTMLNPTFR